MLQRLSLVILIALLVTASGIIQAQTAPDAESYAPQPAFAAYSCQFLAESNQVAIRAVLMGGNGTAVPAGDYRLSVSIGGETLPSSDYRVDIVPQRNPLQIILVLDTTDTVPIAEIVDALISELIPRLRVEDEMALITFSQEIQPRTNFYTDKNRLVNEHILDLLTLEGDNRLYGAIQQAVLDFPVDSGVRRVVLVLTDSGRRESDITPLDAITSSARRNNVQIYPIGFYTRDLPRPERADLVTLATGTGGFAWVYEEPYRNRADVGAAVGGYLDEFVDALNSEILVTVDLAALNTGSANLLTFDLSADTANDAILTTAITCPIEPLRHSIAFVDPLNNAAVQGAVQLGVISQSDFSSDQTVVVFYQNGEVVQDTGASLYTFDPATVAPGNYEIRAELVDRRGNILATTETITLYAQQVLELRLRDGNADQLDGTVEFVLSGREGVVLPEASFSVAPVDDLQNVQPLGSVPFFTTGEAVLRVGDIRAELQRLFPDAPANARYQVSAQVTGISTSDPDPAVVANQLRIGLVVPVTQETPVVVAETPVSLDWVPLAVGAVFLLINLILFIAVRRAWVRRLISHPDDSDFSPQMMSITVYREGMSQSFTLTKRTIFLGRGSTNDINLGGDARISRSHGVIMWRKGKWIYTNRKASLWVKIDGRKRSGFVLQKLKPITEIEIGNALVVYHESAQQDVADFVKTDL
jgi:hypothetical protein